jgi:hypothetical protein
VVAWCADKPEYYRYSTATTTYTVTVLDALGEQGSDALNVSIAPPPIIDEGASTVEDVYCNGAATGSIDLQVSGGTPGYTFSWMGPNGFAATTEDISGLEAGIYTVTITDAQWCTDNADFTVEENNAIEVTANITEPACDATVLGEIFLIASGGEPDYTYEWSTGENTENIVFAQGGIYSVTVTDANGCSQEQVYNVSAGNLL